MLKILLSTVACASVLTVALPSEAVMTPAGTLTAARALTAVRTATGYTLSGELQSLNTCMDVHFVANRMIDGYDALQYKRPGSGPFCGNAVTWKKSTLAITTKRKPLFAHVRVAGPKTIDVAIKHPY
jgi:hypothetical protein